MNKTRFIHIFFSIFSSFYPPPRSIHLWSVPNEKSGHFIYAYFILLLALNLPLTSSSCRAAYVLVLKSIQLWKKLLRTAAGSVCARKIFARKPRRDDEREGGGKDKERERERTARRVPVVLTRVTGRYKPLQLASSFSPTTSLYLLALPPTPPPHLSLSLSRCSFRSAWRRLRRCKKRARAPVELQSPSRARKLSQKSIDSQRTERGWQLVFSESQIAFYRLLRASDARSFLSSNIPISILTNPYKSACK